MAPVKCFPGFLKIITLAAWRRAELGGDHALLAEALGGVDHLMAGLSPSTCTPTSKTMDHIYLLCFRLLPPPGPAKYRNAGQYFCHLHDMTDGP